MSVTILNQKLVKRLLKYNPKTGIFRWRVDRTYNARKGWIAGTKDGRGYWSIPICGKRYKAHRLAWLYMEGYWPEPQIDHINGIRHDNRWKNLRMVSQVCNSQNQCIRSDNKSGFPGVYFEKFTRKWRAQIAHKGKRYMLGRYSDPLEAALARLTGEIECPFWHCNSRSEIVKAIQKVWPEFVFN